MHDALSQLWSVGDAGPKSHLRTLIAALVAAWARDAVRAARRASGVRARPLARRGRSSVSTRSHRIGDGFRFLDPDESGAPGWTRTSGPELRRLVLYPPELRAPGPILMDAGTDCRRFGRAPADVARRLGKGVASPTPTDTPPPYWPHQSEPPDQPVTGAGHAAIDEFGGRTLGERRTAR